MIGPYQMLPLRARTDQGAMAIKEYSTFPKATALLEPNHHVLSQYRTHVLRVLPLCGGAVGVFYSPSRLNLLERLFFFFCISFIFLFYFNWFYFIIYCYWVYFLLKPYRTIWLYANEWPVLNRIILFTNPSARAGYDTSSIFKRSLTELLVININLKTTSQGQFF